MVHAYRNESPLTEDEASSHAHQHADGVEFTREFQDLDASISSYDAEGAGPLRKGEKPFQWEAVSKTAEMLLNKANDLRVSLWLLRACISQRGVSGLVDGLVRISRLLDLPPEQVFPQPLTGETAREVHAIALAWLGSPALLHQFKIAPMSDDMSLSIQDIRSNETLIDGLSVKSRNFLQRAFQSGVNHLDNIAEALQFGDSYLPFDISSLRSEMVFMEKLFRGSETTELVDLGLSQDGDSTSHVTNNVVQKREDANQMLNALIKYFREYEPGHPAPLLLQRVQRMLGASFEELMGELYVDAKQLIARLERPQSL